ncbi:MAG: hypothetical protein CVU63_11845 [Deltaproteobacteria bacterium HGW-Deltaproteobacteria-20]|jgi:predicted transcriptional regulator|nr:MAG: hypothetical protein CVU63_11845 [Deltaproteobacteria bacterium HGW-Deltaproteobacteria-20]
MKKILLEIDDRCARDLERVAPAGSRTRAGFIRMALRRAIDLELDRATAEAYRSTPLVGELTSGDLVGWDERNELALPAKGGRRSRKGGKAA